MNAPGSAADARVYEGVPSRSAALGVAFFGLLLVLSAALPFLFQEHSLRLWVLLALSLAVFGGALVYSLGAWFASRCRYVVDAVGIARRRGRSAERVAWSAVREVAVQPNMLGAGEMLISLRGERGKLLLAIPCDYLRDRGRGLYEDTQHYLAPLFLAKAQAYASGQERWRFGAIRDVVRLEGRQLFAEYPARKRTAIALDDLRRVEVVPKSRTGAFEPAHLRLDHPGGVLRIPLQVNGIYFLPYALKHLYGLGHLTDAVMPVELLAERDRLTAKRSWKVSCRLFACLALGGALFVGFRILLDVGHREQTKTLGVPATATVTSLPEKDFISLRYEDGVGKAHEAKTRVVPGFADDLKVGETIPIRVHPATGSEYWFDGRWELAGRGWLVVGGGLGILVLAGVGFLVNGFAGVRRLRQRLGEIEAAMAPPVPQPAAPTPAVVPPPLPAGTAGLPEPVPAAAAAPTAPAGAAVCSQCSQPLAESYFLSAGQAWCPACTERGRKLTPAKGCRPLVLAFLFGSLAAAAAAGLWALIVILSGYQLGLVAIVVGILVGLAVRKGSGSTGGRRYQVLAMALTVTALAYASVPIAIDALRDDPETMNRLRTMWNQARANAARPAPAPLPEEAAAGSDGAPVQEEGAPADEDLVQEEGTPAGEAPAAPPATAAAEAAPAPAEGTDGTDSAAEELSAEEIEALIEGTQEPPPMSPGKTIGMMLLAVVVLVLAVTVGPFVLYALLLVSDPFSLVFLAIALWEAWRFNRPQDRTFEGPFRTHEEPIDFTEAKP